MHPLAEVDLVLMENLLGYYSTRPVPDDICISKKGLVSTQYTGKKWSSDKFESGSTVAAALKLVTPTEAKIISDKNARE